MVGCAKCCLPHCHWLYTRIVTSRKYDSSFAHISISTHFFSCPSQWHILRLIFFNWLRGFRTLGLWGWVSEVMLFSGLIVVFLDCNVGGAQKTILKKHGEVRRWQESFLGARGISLSDGRSTNSWVSSLFFFCFTFFFYCVVVVIVKK